MTHPETLIPHFLMVNKLFGEWLKPCRAEAPANSGPLASKSILWRCKRAKGFVSRGKSRFPTINRLHTTVLIIC